MKNEIAKRINANLPAVTRQELTALMESPERYYNALPPAKISDPHTDSTPSLGKIKRSIPEEYAMMIVSVALMEVRDWFNTSGNLSDSQIAMLAEMIIDRFYDYSLNEIKAVFRRKMSEGKVYRIDGNVIMGWLSEYDLERDNHSEDMARNGNQYDPNPGAITHKAYIAMLEARANDGGEEPKRILADYRKRSKVCTQEDHRKKQMDFLRYKHEYLKYRGHHDKTSKPQDEAPVCPQDR